MDSTHLHQLVARLFDKEEDKPEPYNYTSSNGQLCPMPRPLLETGMAPVVGNTTFQQLNVYITAGCAGFTTLSILVLMARHATHLSRPNEQLNILRICCYLPIFSVGLFLEAAFPNAYPYLNPWLDFFQAVALANFFLLMCQFVSPSDAQRDAFFAVFEVPKKKLFGGSSGNSDEGKKKKSGLEWYRGLWWCIFQYPVVQLLVSIFTSITEAATVYCLASSSPHFAHLWMDIAHNISLVMAVIAALRIYGALKKELAHHRPLGKLLAFKLVVGVNGLIQLVYWILRSSAVRKKFTLEPTDTLSWSDEYIGIPVLILSLVCVPFSLFFHHAYSVSPYYLDRASQNKPLAYSDAYDMEAADAAAAAVNPVGSRYQGGPLGVWAWAGIFNPSEFVAGLRFGLQMRSNARRRQNIAYEENTPLTTLPAYRSGQNSPPPPQAYVR